MRWYLIFLNNKILNLNIIVEKKLQLEKSYSLLIRPKFVAKDKHQKENSYHAVIF